LTIGDFIVSRPEVLEEDGTAREGGTRCSAGLEIGAVLLLLEVAVVTVDDVDCFRALVETSDPF
jgi:hypothetical protein